MTLGTPPPGPPGAFIGISPTRVVRIRLSHDRPAPQPDPLGRARVGYAEGLEVADLWDRGRGVWRMKAKKVVEASLLVITYADVVRLVGTIEGLSKHDDRLAVIGHPLPDHSLIGSPDPVPNESRFPIAYGTVNVPQYWNPDTGVGAAAGDRPGNRSTSS